MNWRTRCIVSGLALAVVGVASAATFNLFQPASGILKGNPSTYVTTAAAASDVISLWSGTCNSSTFLRGDGSCQAAGGGGGTVTSITAGTGISASPSSPITTSGTLSVNQAFSPTWTGTHTFSNDFTVNGVSSADLVNVNNTTTWLINTDASGQGLTFVNSSTGTSALTALVVANSTHGLSASLSSTGFSGSILTGGPSGESAALWTDAAVPLSLGTNDTERVRIDSTFVNVASDNLDHTGSGGNWRLHQDASNWSVDQCDSFNTDCLSKLTFSVTGNHSSLGSGGDTTITSGSGSISMTGGNVDVATSGHLRVNLSGAGAKNVCLEDGTNCPSGGGDATLAGNQTFTGINTFSNASNAFTGSGAGLTALNAGNVSTGTLAVARGGTGTTTSTGTGSVVLSASPTLTGTVTAATVAATTLTGAGSGITALNMGNASSGTLAVARGGTGVTTSTGTGNVVLSASPTLTGTTTAATVNATTFVAGNSFNPDTDLGADLGTASLRFLNTYTSTLCIVDCSTGIVVDSTGTTARLGNGSSWTAIALPKNTTVTGTLAATAVTGDGSGLTSLDAGDISAGTLAVARGGTGVTTSTGTGSVVLSASPTLTGTATVATLAATAATVGGSNVCRADGTDCPSSSVTTASDSPSCTGFSSVGSCNAVWTKAGRTACISYQVSGTSNTTAFTMTGITAPNPTLTTNTGDLARVFDNSVGVLGNARYATGGGTLTFGVGADTTGGFTASGSKGASGTYCYATAP